jgi:thiol-disulfide isomerase/thioredoxin
MPQWLKGLLVLLAAQLVFVAIWALGDREESVAPTRPAVVQVLNEEELDEPAPTFAWETADGKVERLADLRGEPVVVHFWGTWCPPCVEEIPALLRWNGGEARLVAVAVDDTRPSLELFFDGEVPVQVVFPRRSAGAFDVKRLPATFLVSADGRLVRRWDGAREWSDDDAAKFLR